MTGLLSSIDKVAIIPTSICRFGSHACFGYRVLEVSIKTLSEILHSVTELCGTTDIPCPTLSPRSSPDQDSIPLPPTLSLYRNPKDRTVVTAEDYLETEEEINEWISKLQQQERRNSPAGPSVMCSCINLLPLIDHLSFRHHLQGQKQSNVSEQYLPAAVAVVKNLPLFVRFLSDLFIY